MVTVRCELCSTSKPLAECHKQGQYTHKDGTIVVRYACRPCKKAKVHRYRAIRIGVQQ